MIYCRNCKRFIDDDDVRKIPNKVPYGLGEVIESYTYECRYCDSQDLDYDPDTVICENCGQVIYEPDANYVDESILCDDCI